MQNQDVQKLRALYSLFASICSSQWSDYVESCHAKCFYYTWFSLYWSIWEDRLQSAATQTDLTGEWITVKSKCFNEIVMNRCFQEFHSNTRPPLMSKLRLLQKANRNLVIEVYIKVAVSVIFLFIKDTFSHIHAHFIKSETNNWVKGKKVQSELPRKKESRASVVM